MKKTVEIEYVGIEDVQEILDDAYAVTKEGNYVSVEMASYDDGRAYVRCLIMLDGFDAGKPYDYCYTFVISDEQKHVDEMNRCKSILKNLLVEE